MTAPHLLRLLRRPREFARAALFMAASNLLRRAIRREAAPLQARLDGIGDALARLSLTDGDGLVKLRWERELIEPPLQVLKHLRTAVDACAPIGGPDAPRHVALHALLDSEDDAFQYPYLGRIWIQVMRLALAGEGHRAALREIAHFRSLLQSSRTAVTDLRARLPTAPEDRA